MSTPVAPRFLVSVRDVAELNEALSGGVDIVDVKEPRNGPLGMAETSVIQAVSQRLLSIHSDVGLSIALGELRDWDIERPAIALPERATWVKMGFAGAAMGAGWRSRWMDVRRRIDAASARQLAWIAVAYADHEAAKSPPVREVLHAAVETGCAGFLIDTCSKSRGTLADCLPPVALVDLLRIAREQQLPVALAGKVSTADLPWLCDLEPAIIAVRSAVCAGGNRRRQVSATLVALFRRELQQAFKS